MAASDHLRPEQLQMFMPASQIASTHALSDARRQSPAGHASLLAAKARQNDRYGKPDMGRPIMVSHDPWPGSRGRPVVWDGHHRLAEGLRQSAELPLHHIDEKNWW